MAKRFSETKIWEDIWYQDLPIEWKMLWKYVCDKCDEAGIWKVNQSLAEFQLKIPVKWDETDKWFNSDKKRIDFHNGFWIINDFVSFQYGDKVWTSINPFHKKVREMLDRVSHRVLDTHKVKDKEKVMVKDIEVIRGVVGEIINDLNQVLNTNYKLTSGKTQELIQARLNDGFCLEDFKVVHRKMAQAWGIDNKMRQYLRPLTLYSNKFESYLNRPADIKQLTTQQQNNLKGLAQLNKEIGNDKRSIQ